MHYQNLNKNLIRIYCQTNKIKFVSYRLGYVFGSNMYKRRLVSRLLDNFKKKKKIKLYNQSLNLNLIHSKDVSEIIIKTYKRAEGIYNLVNKKRLISLLLKKISRKKNKVKT